ncbi:hypothetical protein [Companilactobacillus hulinensis]|uniref:hypothetical protein n=1 Tax=Companilactobacillus hulinensis TaxID=2486007 RepID=UPI000F7A95E3|nr:hypothetical protein [Companilactobacillus hulinensis]
MNLTAEEIIAAAKKAGIKASVAPEGKNAAFVSEDGTMRHEMKGYFFDTSSYYGPWKDPRNRTADDPNH